MNPLYRITTLAAVLASAIALLGLAWQTHMLNKAENRAVAATNLAGEYQRSLEASEALLRAVRESAANERRTLENRAKAHAQAAAKAKKEAYDLKQALEANRDWADQPVPPAVARVLNQEGDSP